MRQSTARLNFPGGFGLGGAVVRSDTAVERAAVGGRIDSRQQWLEWHEDGAEPRGRKRAAFVCCVRRGATATQGNGGARRRASGDSHLHATFQVFYGF